MGFCYFLSRYAGCLCSYFVKPWSLTHSKLFTWPLTSLAETGNKEANPDICKGIHRGTCRGRRRLRHIMWSAKMCCSRVVGVQKETCSAVSAKTRHKRVSKLLQSFLACLLSPPYLSAEVTGSGAPASDLLKLLSGPGGQHWCWESGSPGLGNHISAESYQRAHKVGKRAGQCYGYSEQRNLVSLCLGCKHSCQLSGRIFHSLSFCPAAEKVVESIKMFSDH